MKLKKLLALLTALTMAVTMLPGVAMTSSVTAAGSDDWRPTPTRTVTKASDFPVTLQNGDVLKITGESISYTSTKTGESPISVASGATVSIIIDAKVTLKGADGSGREPGAAAIRVPESSTLTIYGGQSKDNDGNDPALILQGGNAGKGEDGGNAVSSRPTAEEVTVTYDNGRYHFEMYCGGMSGFDGTNNTGGYGGAGGGGAGAAIGGNGGWGGDRTKTPSSQWYTRFQKTYDTNEVTAERINDLRENGTRTIMTNYDDTAGQNGTNGNRGSSGDQAGKISILGNLTLDAVAGSSAKGGNGGKGGAGFADTRGNDIMVGGCGGGGGGAGGARAPAGIGAGGPGGGSGGAGGTMSSDYKGNIAGNGGGGGGAGYNAGYATADYYHCAAGAGGGGGTEASDLSNHNTSLGGKGSNTLSGYGSNGSGSSNHDRLTVARGGTTTTGGEGGKFSGRSEDRSGGSGGNGGRGGDAISWNSNLVISTDVKLERGNATSVSRDDILSTTTPDPNFIYNVEDCQINLTAKQNGSCILKDFVVDSVVYSKDSDRDKQSILLLKQENSNASYTIPSNQYTVSYEQVSEDTGRITVTGTDDPNRATVKTNGAVVGSVTKEIHLDHSYVNGFCTKCDVREPAVLSADGSYQVSNGGQLFWLAEGIENKTVDRSKSINLTADISLESSEDGEKTSLGITKNRNFIGIGPNENEFRGSFFGNHCTISNLLMDVQMNGEKKGATGLFERFKGSVVSDLTVEGNIKIYIGENGHIDSVGGIIGNMNGGRISNVTSRVNITVDGTQDKAVDQVGGIVGFSWGTCYVEKCMNFGSVTVNTDAANAADKPKVGGIAGRPQDITIQNCANYGTVRAAKQNVPAGGIAGSIYTTSAAVRNNYNYGNVSNGGGNFRGAVVGSLQTHRVDYLTNNYYLTDTAPNGFGSGSISTTAVTTVKTAEEFASGEVCYLLNGSVNSGDGVWKQDLDNGNTPYDTYPVFDGGAVYLRADDTYSNYLEGVSVTISWGDIEFGYQNGAWDPKTHTYADGSWTQNTPDGNVLNIENKSRVAVGVGATFTPEPGFTSCNMQGTFRDSKGVLSDVVRVESGSTLSAALSLTSSKPVFDAADKAQKIGTITISLTSLS
ncbi:MAG: hypothetical protein HFE85_02650 [Clostridiales bacterium]|nr:hypothetical protein [Clostridiales bacterium]